MPSLVRHFLFLLTVALLPTPILAADVTLKRGITKDVATNPGLKASALKGPMRIDPDIYQTIHRQHVPNIPATDSLEQAYNLFRTRHENYLKSATRYRTSLLDCSRRTYSIADQRSAGCQPVDTVFSCNRKLIMWCSNWARTQMYSARRGMIFNAISLQGQVRLFAGMH